MTRLLTSTVGFVISYLVLMIPTYLLPYAGSNSAIINGVGALLGRGPTPQWWMHFWCLFMLILIGHVRGRLVGKSFLLVFPIVALVFDLTPGLSAIPLVPTLMHLLCLILGAVGIVTPQTTDALVAAPSFRRTGLTAAGVSALSVAGMLWFAFNTHNTGAAMRATRAPVSDKSAERAVATPQARAEPVPAPASPPAAATLLSPPPQSTPTPPTEPVEAAMAVPPAVTVHKPVPPRPTAAKPSAHAEKVEKSSVRMINIRD